MEIMETQQRQRPVIMLPVWTINRYLGQCKKWVNISRTDKKCVSNVEHVHFPYFLSQVIPTVVYLMSRIAVHMEIEGTAQCPSQVMLAAALGCEELGISNKLLAQNVFGLWMTSPLLETQLKPHHRPFAVRVAWTNLLEKYSHGNELEKHSDEPMISLRRNCFYSRRDEEKIKWVICCRWQRMTHIHLISRLW